MHLVTKYDQKLANKMRISDFDEDELPRHKKRAKKVRSLNRFNKVNDVFYSCICVRIL